MTPSSPAATATNTYTTAGEIRHSIRPWFDDFLSLSSLSLPLSFPELSLRLRKNLHTFRGNYAIVSLFIFFSTLILRPFALILFIAIITAWIYLLFAGDDPLVVFDFEIGGRLVLISLSVVTFVAVAATRVWWNLFLGIAISALVVCLHAIVRVPDDAESPYGALLTVDEEDGEAARGPYVAV